MREAAFYSYVCVSCVQKAGLPPPAFLQKREMFSLRPSTASDGVGLESCELTEAQLVSIRAAMFGRNASCSYNMTVGSALLGD